MYVPLIKTKYIRHILLYVGMFRGFFTCVCPKVASLVPASPVLRKCDDHVHA